MYRRRRREQCCSSAARSVAAMSPARLALGAAVVLAMQLCVLAAMDYGAFVENRDMNPCEDFYTYTCESQYRGPDGSVSDFKSLVAEAQDSVVAKLKGILEDSSVDEAAADGSPIGIARAFYASCMGTERIDAQGIAPIRSVLKELRGWPVLGEQPETDQDNWQDLHTFYCKVNVCPLYEVSVNSDALRRTHTIMLRQPKTIVREPLLFKPKTFHNYVDYIKSIALLVANTSESSVTEEEVAAGAKQIASFEAELSKILEGNERLDFYRPTPLTKFQNVTNQLIKNKNKTLNWIKIINGMYSTTLVSIEDNVDISTLSYFPRLIQLLQKTPSQTVVNYIHWRFVHKFLPHTSSELRSLYSEMKNFMYDSSKSIPRWRFCGFEPALDHALSYTFSQKYISSKTEKYVQRVLNDIKQVTIRAIKRSFLLNEDEKSMAEQKVLSMNFVLGIPEPLKNLSVLNRYYKQLSISGNYFNNVLTLRKFYKMKEFEIVKGNEFNLIENDKFMRITTISSIGSAYDFFENRVLIKIENLIAPLFDADFPEFKKYGILGFTLAYEIMHAFNDADSIGSTKPRRHLYSEETKLKYWDKMECFINQFDNYYIPDPVNPGKHIYVDGERSSIGNMADTASVQIAFQTYRERSRKQGVSSIEDDEDFFVSFANLLCRPELEDFYLSRFNLGLRTLPRFRVIGSLSNTNEFAKTFACSHGARMNPESKCNFWN